MLTYSMLWQCLIEAEARVADTKLPQKARTNSQETVDLINERLRRERMTRAQLERLAFAD